MSSLNVRPLSSPTAFRRSAAAVEFDDATEEEVSRIWAVATANPASALRDEQIVCVLNDTETRHVAPVPYRYFFAQTVRPGLFETPINALAVSGLVRCDGRLLLGRRSEGLLQDAGALELAPSGSVDADCIRADGTVDFKAQFDRELIEELGIPSDWAHGHRSLGLIEDSVNHVTDVVVRSELSCTFTDLREAHSRLEHPEYTELLALTPEQLQQIIDNGSDRFSAVSVAAFRHFGAVSSA